MVEDTALTPLEVAEILKITKNTVYELIKRGELNGYKVGKKIRVDMKDVEEYKNSTKTIKHNREAAVNKQSSVLIQKDEYISRNEINSNNGFVICGQDIMLDVLVRHLEYHPHGIQALRSYLGSYNGLYELYHGNVQVATSHLWDGETDQYNIPYVKRLLPGVQTVIVHLADRMQGFYVAKGNPKGIYDWKDLGRSDITIINREKGSGTRILLDEHLKLLGINPLNINGYGKEFASHLAVASAVSRGSADVALGNEKNAVQVKGIDFIPLQKERYDLVMKKEDIGKADFQAVLEIINSEEFKMELEGIGG
ncbi:MAG: helix-turn-helix transcriptional regulator, partial [Bacillota bacterium]|nr:helix-turn-helix transcriptional regulator [Bacillota bacterium]